MRTNIYCAPHQRSGAKHALPVASTTGGLSCRASTRPESGEIELDHRTGLPLRHTINFSPKVASKSEERWEKLCTSFVLKQLDSIWRRLLASVDAISYTTHSTVT